MSAHALYTYEPYVCLNVVRTLKDLMNELSNEQMNEGMSRLSDFHERNDKQV
jgi:hypothetical protein